MDKDLLCIGFLFLVCSCASRPVLYPNAKYQSVPEKEREKDIDQCLEKADQFTSSKKGQKILKGAGRGSLIGGAIGAMTGLLSGDLIGGALSGGVVGAAAGGAGAAITPDQLKQAFTQKCLNRKRYELVGWD